MRGKKLKKFLKDEDGGMILVMFPGLVIIGMMLFAMMFNIMFLSYNRYHTQLMIDAASRSGVIAVDKSYAIKERAGHGMEDYHVYTELDPHESIKNADEIMNCYENDMYGVTITSKEYNPSDLESPVWNSRTFQYDEKLIPPKKQFKNGSLTIRVTGEMKTVGNGLINNGDNVGLSGFSRSSARGQVTGIR